MKEGGKVTIIVTLYNKEFIIQRVLYSIMNQTYDDWRCVIVNDESTDKSVEFVMDLIENDDRFELINIKHIGIKGPWNARNVGLQTTKTKYVIFFDADDFILPDYLSRAVNFLDNNEKYSMYFESEYLFNENKEYRVPRVRVYANDWRLDLISMIEKPLNMPNMCGSLFRTEMAKDIMFKNVYYEDIDFIIRYLYKFKYFYLNSNAFMIDYNLTQYSEQHVNIIQYNEQIKNTGLNFFEYIKHNHSHILDELKKIN